MTATRHERFPVNGIHVPERIRARVDDDKVSALAESIAKIGLMTPVTVYLGERSPEKIAGPILVAGLHRLLAARKLGSYDIACIVTSANRDERRMWEIAENLHRSELTDLERSEHMAEWLRLSKKGVQLGHPAQPHDKGISAAARDLGVSRQQVQRAVKIASITPEAKDAATDAGLADNQSALQKIAAAPKDEQVATVERITRDRENRSANLRREPTPEEKAEREMQDRLSRIVIDRLQDWYADNRNATVELICDALRDVVIRLQDGDVELGQ